MPKKDAIEDVYPLTPLQEGLLFHSIYSREGGLYHDQFSALLRGPLQPEALAEAWRDVVAAVPVLRTAFAWRSGGAPRQVVARRVETGLVREDWRSLGRAEQARRRDALRASDLAQGFDLARPPLTRATLAQLADDAWFLLWSRHHLLLDGWSVTLVLREWLAAYGARARGAAPAFPPVRPFRDYVAWLKERDEGAAEAHWRRALADVEQATPLGLAAAEGRGGEMAAEERYSEVELELERGETDALRALAASARVTPATVLQGAWALLLARLSGEGEVVFGQTVAGRPADLAGVEAMIGLFINTLPRRIRIRPAETLEAWLRAVQAEAVGAREFEHTPLVRVQAWSGVARDRPLFETLLVVENYPADQALGSLGAVRVEEARSHERTHYPLTLIAAPGRTWSLRLLYDRVRVSERQAKQWRDSLRALLAGMGRGADLRVGSLGVLGAVEESRILGEWNATNQARDRGATLVSLVRDQAARTPEAIAVTDGRHSLSYRQLQGRAWGLARRLRAAGVGPEDRVGVCLGRSVDLVASLVGILECGAAYVPLDPAYPPERLAFMATDAGLAALVTQPEFSGRIPTGTAAVLHPEGDAVPGEPGAAPHPAQLAYLIYTSGSTGRPKAAAIEHRQAAALVHWALGVFSRAELAGMFFSTSVCFDLSVFEVFVTLASGGRVIVGENALDLAAHPARSEVTFVNTVPSAAAELARQGAFPASVGTICLAGEPLTAALADRLYTLSGIRRVCDAYGPSEDTTYSTFAQRERGGPATIGRVLANSRLYLLGEDLQPAPVGAIGEIHLAGEGLARGYFGRPELTAERFMPDPFSPEPGGRLYRTGDLARFRDDGSLEFLGRKDHQLKLRGYRIELGEIQARLELHPEVAEAAVLVREHPARGKYLAAFAAGKPDATLSAERLAEWVRLALPAYMMPSAWHFLARLPRTPNGKLDRRALPEDVLGGPAGSPEVAPRLADPAAEIVAGIWAEVLGVGAVQPADNFFELGGHSLLATQAIARVRAALQTEVPLRVLFEHPTLAAFAGAMRRQRLGAGEAAPISARSAGAPPPLSFAQERMWAMERLAPGSAAYHLPSVLEARGLLDSARLRRALEDVALRHEALRMRFPDRGGNVEAVVGEDSAVLWREVEAADAAEAGRLAAAEAAAPFDLARGPLLRACLIRLGPEHHWLQLTVHHIATDGWSEWILVRELAALYAGRELEEPPVRYGDYAAWQRRRLEGGDLAPQLGWWREELAGVAALDLPLDRARPVDATGRGGRVEARLGEIETEQLRAAARAQNGTLFMALLAAWEVWLWRHSGQEGFGIGVPVAGRSRPELETVIGLFVNTVVVRSDVGAGGSFAELLGRVRERTLRAFDRQEAPFAQVVEAAQPPRELGRAPLFQVMFNLQNAPRVELDLGAVAIRPVELETVTAKAELSLNAAERPDGTVGLSLEFSRDLFEPATAARFLARFSELIAAIAAEPNRALAELRWLPAGDSFRMPERKERYAPDLPAVAPRTFAAPAGEAEQLLAGLWAELLRLPVVGRHDNFFALGGDSIIALQVAARAGAAGWLVPAQAVFTRQTLAELAGAARPAAPGGGTAAGGAIGSIALSPIQRWFFELNLAQPGHWNQSSLLATPANFDPERARAALADLALRHEALRLRFRRGPAGWNVSQGPAAGSTAFEVRPLAELAAGSAAAQSGLNLADGPLLQAVYFPGRNGEEGRLLLVVHHLAIDGVSWRILLDDLAVLYGGAKPPPAPAWSAWARALAAEASRPEVAAELPFWGQLPEAAPLPRDFAAPGRGRAGEESSIVSLISTEGTALLLREATAAHRAQIDELLAAALAWALRDWTGQERVTLALERHGREGLAEAPAPAETLGWFTNLYPASIELAGGRTPEAALRAAKEALRSAPRKGLGYGLLRYLGSGEVRKALGRLSWPELCLNYLGQFDASADSGGFRAAKEGRGADHHPDNARPFLIEINAGVEEGMLRCTWNFSRAHHRQETIMQLADRFTLALTALIAGRSAAGSSAPSDFSAAGLSQTDLEKVLGRLR